jgi:hypothetical protein
VGAHPHESFWWQKNLGGAAIKCVPQPRSAQVQCWLLGLNPHQKSMDDFPL